MLSATTRKGDSIVKKHAWIGVITLIVSQVMLPALAGNPPLALALGESCHESVRYAYLGAADIQYDVDGGWHRGGDFHGGYPGREHLNVHIVRYCSEHSRYMRWQMRCHVYAATAIGPHGHLCYRTVCGPDRVYPC
jgi:hypothetical protein